MKKILIVDDQKNVRISLSIGLRREGYQVDVAGDALEALLKMKEASYDVLLADVRMPEINGIELANKVAKLYPHIWTILMSAYDFKDFEKNYQELPKYPRLSKPFEITELLTLLDDKHKVNLSEVTD